ncbi:hypothetical protein HZU73_02309 [Apis mellifera caucasica]|nr:hypothetical protein HZU73_02309 [Apis mellifera caucasica]
MLNQRHYRVNSEEEERDISAKGRRGEKKQTKGWLDPAGWTMSPTGPSAGGGGQRVEKRSIGTEEEEGGGVKTNGLVADSARLPP